MRVHLFLERAFVLFDLIQCTVLHRTVDLFIERIRATVQKSLPALHCAKWDSLQQIITYAGNETTHSRVTHIAAKEYHQSFSDFDWKCFLSYYTEMFLNNSFKITMGGKQANREINVIHVKLNSSSGNFDISSQFLIVSVGGNLPLFFSGKKLQW